MVFHISGQHMYTSLRGGCATISVNLGASTIERNLVQVSYFSVSDLPPPPLQEQRPTRWS